MQLSVRGFTFELHVGGPADGPTVLLLHGFPQHSGEWAVVSWRLHAAGLRTVALDQRGYSPGARPAEVQQYQLTECVADVLAVLDALEIDACHVVGHDWGALVGWRLAAEFPARVRSLTAVSVPHPSAIQQATVGDAGADQRARSAYIGLFRQAGKAEQVLLAEEGRRLRELLVGVPSQRVGTYLDRLLVPPAPGTVGALTAALNWYRALSRAELADAPPVSVPTTFVWSDQDPAIGRLAAQYCAGQVTGDYRLVELAGVSHWVPDEAPNAVAEAIITRIGV